MKLVTAVIKRFAPAQVVRIRTDERDAGAI
jgi:hypothetical protein